jgi:small subunit ribosomal protein S16
VVSIRLKRLGRTNRPWWRICATDQRAARDGRVIEELGWYDPHRKNEDKIEINRERVAHWLKKGAQPSDTVRRLLLHAGIDPKGNEVAPRPWRKKKPRRQPAAKTEAASEPAKTEGGAPAAPPAGDAKAPDA